MIRIGLAGWGDQMELYPEGLPAKQRLRAYAEHFSMVEVDSSFYAVQPARYYEKWAEETPASFRFVVKAYQGMTGHARGALPYPDEGAMFREFRASVEPVMVAGKLGMVLFQYPPWFDCSRRNVEVLRQARELLPDLPLTLEFRHQSWFEGELRERTLEYMKREGWIHSVCDEPQAGEGSVPTVLVPTDRSATLVRFHGRNEAGWNRAEGQNWREVRYLYDYSEAELAEWARWLRELERESETVYVVFNNNSGGHAAGNAKLMERLLGLQPGKELPPRQIEWLE